jgi:hypothetical protein
MFLLSFPVSFFLELGLKLLFKLNLFLIKIELLLLFSIGLPFPGLSTLFFKVILKRTFWLSLKSLLLFRLLLLIPFILLILLSFSLSLIVIFLIFFLQSSILNQF